jgi:DNA-binding NarL/FixJ family response regulator
MANNLIRVVIADDNAVVRRGVAALLEAADGIEVAGEASNGKEAIVLTEELKPDVVLCDVRMPVMDGVTAVKTISKHVPVMMLTYAEDEDLVTGAIRAGASGYLVHGRFEPDELESAVRDLIAGESVLSPSVVPVVFDALRHRPETKSSSGPNSLTERELEVMNLLAKGRSNPQIATQLWLSEKTVKNHVNHIYAKLGVVSRAEAIARWLGVTHENESTSSS